MQHSIRVLRQLHPEWVQIGIDLANAFNTLSREALVEVLEADTDLRALVPLVTALRPAGHLDIFRRWDQSEEVAYVPGGIAAGLPPQHGPVLFCHTQGSCGCGE